MATFSEAVADAVRSSACAVLAGSDLATQFVNSVIGLDADAGNVARALRRQVCDNDDDVVNLPQPPFTGGQCPGQEYRFTARYNWLSVTNCTNGNPITTPYNDRGPDNFPIYGPIGWSVAPTKNASCGPSEYRGTLTGRNAVGVPQSIDILVATTGNINWGGVLTVVTPPTVTTVGGVPDPCGDPEPPPIDPFPTTTFNTNITYDNSQSVTINEGIDINIFAPLLGFNGQIFAPITIETPDFNFKGTVQLSPKFELNITPGNAKKSPGESDDEAPEPLPVVPQPPEDAGPRLIIGALITVTNLDGTPVTQIQQGGNPDIWVPRLGSCSFYIDSPAGQGWTVDLDVKNLRQYVPCPVSFGAVDVAATPALGVTFDVEPIYGYPTALF